VGKIERVALGELMRSETKRGEHRAFGRPLLTTPDEIRNRKQKNEKNKIMGYRCRVGIRIPNLINTEMIKPPMIAGRGFLFSKENFLKLIKAGGGLRGSVDFPGGGVGAQRSRARFFFFFFCGGWARRSQAPPTANRFRFVLFYFAGWVGPKATSNGCGNMSH
jgi:hypothetical protein